jgi:TPR repeat protein
VSRFLDDYYGYGFVDDPDKSIDPRRAVRWVRKGAEGAAENDPACLMRLGIHLFDGTGVRKNRRRALALYRRAAALEDSRAAYLLGRCYAEGQGVSRDRRRARKWLERATQAGETDARRALAKLRRGSTKTAQSTSLIR